MVDSFEQYQMEATRRENNTWRPILVYGRSTLLGVVIEDIQPQGGITLLPLAAGELTVVSDSPDDSFAGIGLEALVIQGLDSGYGNGGLSDTEPYYSEVLLMDGTTPVSASIDLLRVTVVGGLLGTTVGTITIAIDGVTQLVLLAGTATTASARTTMPEGWTGYGHGITAQWSASNPVALTLSSEIQGTPLATIMVDSNQNNSRLELGPVEFPPTSDVIVRGQRVAGGGTDRLSTLSDGWLERN